MGRPFLPIQIAPLAQLDRATGYEPVGREFESLRAHHSSANRRQERAPGVKLPRANLECKSLPRLLRPLGRAKVCDRSGRWMWHESGYERRQEKVADCFSQRRDGRDPPRRWRLLEKRFAHGSSRRSAISVSSAEAESNPGRTRAITSAPVSKNRTFPTALDPIAPLMPAPAIRTPAL